MRTVILGGVAAGAATATRLRRLDETREITVIESGAYPSFANCALPYYLSGEVSERNKLFATTPEFLKNFFKLDLRLNSRAYKLDLTKRIVYFTDENGAESSIEYDDLVIATGTDAVIPPFASSSKRIRALKNIPDVDFIKSLLDNGARRVLVVGGGAIGLEAAENLRSAGLKVTLCEYAPHVLPRIDDEIVFYAQEQLKDHGVSLRCSCTVSELNDTEKGINALFNGKDGEVREEFDFAVICAGVKPNTEFAVEAGLDADARGFLLTDENMRCSDPHVFAAGDVAAVPNTVTGQIRSPLLATPVSQEVRALTSALCELKPHSYKGNIGVWVVKVFDTAVGSCGASLHECQSAGFDDAICISTHGFDHTTFYPGASRLHLKLCFSKQSGKVFGIQAAGEGHAVVDALNRVAAVIHFNGTVSDLRALDHAYAPPYSSARDPVIMSGAVAENVCDGLFNPVSYEDLAKFEDAIKIDVRSPDLFKKCHYEGFVNIPAVKIRSRLKDIPRDKRVLVSCMVGQSAYECARIMQQAGFKDVYVLTGSMLTLQAAGVNLTYDRG